MYTLYNLDEGTNVDVPLLDGVIERALKLMDEWRAKKPELEVAPSYLLFFNALTCSDLVRTTDAFQKAGLNEDLCLRFAHSRLPEVLMYAGVTALLGINTWWLDNKINTLTDPPNAFGLTRDDATGKERFKKREPWEELRTGAEFKVELTHLVGPEATELLFQACQAYDRWARELDQKPSPEAGQGTKPGGEIESMKKLEFKTEQLVKPAPEMKPAQQPVLDLVPPAKPAPETRPEPKSELNIEQSIKPEIKTEPMQKQETNATPMEKINPPSEQAEKQDLHEEPLKKPEAKTAQEKPPESTIKQESNTETATSKNSSG